MTMREISEKTPIRLTMGAAVVALMALLPVARSVVLADVRATVQAEVAVETAHHKEMLAPYATREWVVERLETRMERMRVEIVALRVAIERLREH